MIEVERDLFEREGTILTYRIPGQPLRGQRVEVVTGKLMGIKGTVLGPSMQEFPYYEIAAII